MKYTSFIVTIFALCFLLAENCPAANKSNEKEYLQNLLNGICSIGACDNTLNPFVPEQAEEIIRNSSYILHNTQYEQLARYNEPLKKMGIENTMLVPLKWVENAVCQYYGYDVNQTPPLQKAFEEQGKYGFIPLGASDGGEADYQIEKMDIMKNGILRVSGKDLSEEPFIAYFGISSCGGVRHWVPLRVSSPVNYEETDNFSPIFK